MIIVKIMGGLGNQMFQYALYRSLQSQGKDVKMYIGFFDTTSAHNGYELPIIFDIKDTYISKYEVDRYNNAGLLVFAPPLRAAIQFIPEVYHMEDMFMAGYWQSEKYFSQISDIIREDFQFLIPLNQKSEKIRHMIQDSNSVSIHVRRGDYLKIADIFGTTNLNYYNSAIDKIREGVPDAKFFIFSDDIVWCRENLKIEDAQYIGFNVGSDSHMDMHLMSLCKHNIITNSSFSWWAAWLNSNPDKIVIAPEQWFVDAPPGDIVPDGWIKMGGVRLKQTFD